MGLFGVFARFREVAFGDNLRISSLICNLYRIVSRWRFYGPDQLPPRAGRVYMLRGLLHCHTLICIQRNAGPGSGPGFGRSSVAVLCGVLCDITRRSVLLRHGEGKQ